MLVVKEDKKGEVRSESESTVTWRCSGWLFPLSNDNDIAYHEACLFSHDKKINFPTTYKEQITKII